MFVCYSSVLLFTANLPGKETFMFHYLIDFMSITLQSFHAGSSCVRTTAPMKLSSSRCELSSLHCLWHVTRDRPFPAEWVFRRLVLNTVYIYKREHILSDSSVTSHSLMEHKHGQHLPEETEHCLHCRSPSLLLSSHCSHQKLKLVMSVIWKPLLGVSGSSWIDKILLISQIRFFFHCFQSFAAVKSRRCLPQ